MDNSHLIHLNNIKKIYKIGETSVNALKGVSYKIDRGDFVAIMGPSGSGKSTLMNIIGCLDKPSEGGYLLENQEVSKMDRNQLARIRNKRIGFVFQSFNLLPRTTALENTELPLLYSKTSTKNAKELAFKSLSLVGLQDRAFHKTNQLSGGEQQRVAVARALVNNPSLLLADEPTGNLDTKTGDELMQIFKHLNENQRITIIVVTHDVEVAEYAQKRIYLRDGLIIKDEIIKEA